MYGCRSRHLVFETSVWLTGLCVTQKEKITMPKKEKKSTENDDDKPTVEQTSATESTV